jgi:hypothetical protein
LYGLSYNRNIGPFAVGAEVSYVQHAALHNAAALAPNGKGPRGDLVNVDLNTVVPINNTPFFDTSSVAADIGFQHLDSVTDRAQYYNGVGYPTCTGVSRKPGSGDIEDGCATKNSLQAAVNFTPEWLQVLPALDISLPLTVNDTIYGNGAALAASASQGHITYSVGVKADYRSQYSAQLTYADSFAHYHEHDGVVANGNGPWWYNDKGRVTLTLKTTF